MATQEIKIEVVGLAGATTAAVAKRDNTATGTVTDATLAAQDGTNDGFYWLTIEWDDVDAANEPIGVWKWKLGDAAGSHGSGYITLVEGVVTYYLEDSGEESIAGVKSDTETLLGRLGAWTGSGINTVLGAFRAIAAKASSLTPSDLSDSTTFSNTTDSMEAIRDRGDSAWTGDGGGGGVVVVPLVGTIQERVQETSITVYTSETSTITLPVVDPSGEAVDLSGLTLVFIIERKNGTDKAVIEDAAITVTDSTIAFATPAAVSANRGEYVWALREAGENTVLMYGSLRVSYAPQVD